MMDQPPITGADLDRWAQRFPAADIAALALLNAGIPGDLDEIANLSSAAGRTTTRGFVPWSLNFSQFRELESQTGGPGWSRATTARIMRGLRARAPVDRAFLRLAIGGDVVPGEVIPRLLRGVGVDSAIVPAERPLGALKRREWSWPLRMGFAGLDFQMVRSAIASRPECPPDEQLDLRDISVEPAAIDVLVVAGPLADAVARVRASRQIANSIVVLDTPAPFWPVADGQLAVVRAATGAVVTVVSGIPSAQPELQLAAALCTLVRRMSIGQPFDVAVTAAFGAAAIVTGEPDPLRDSADLGAIVRRVTSDLRYTLDQYQPATDVTGWRSQLQSLEATSRLRDPTGYAGGDLVVFDEFALPPLDSVRDSIRSELPPPPPRYLQCVIRPRTSREPKNQIHSGANEVDVFVGPQESDLIAGLLDEDHLGFRNDDVESARVSVVLVPLTPRGRPLRTELEVPRYGRSGNATLMWNVPPKSKTASARILLVHRNRVLQTAVLSGTVDRLAQLKQLVVLRNEFADLDDRKPFDAVIVKNSDQTGRSAVMILRDGEDLLANNTVLTELGEQIGALLIKAARWHGSTEAAKRGRHQALIDLAVKGFDFWSELTFQAPDLANARYVQILTVHGPRELPLELAYTRAAPQPDAVICPSWLNGGQGCGAGCGAGENDASIVCPGAFWGLSRVVERHYAPPRKGGGAVKAGTRNPVAHARRLAVDSALVAGSKRVTKKALQASVSELAAGTVHAKSWAEWKDTLAKAPARNLLVLMPHSMPGPALEIAGDKPLGRAYLMDNYVVGISGDSSHPVVVLFGCDTAGSKEDPAGWVSRFIQRKAAVVFSTLTMLYAGDAAKLAEIMARLLRAPDRQEQSVGELSRAFRAKAVRNDVIAALGVATYGDADWTV